MHFELASLEGFWEVQSKDKRFDRLDHSAAFALLVEFHDAHTSDQLLHFGCNLAPQVVIPSSSHKTPPNGPERFSRVLYETYFADTIAGFIQFTSAPVRRFSGQVQSPTRKQSRCELHSSVVASES